MKTGLSLSVGLKTELKLQPRQILCNELLLLPLLDLEVTLQTELEENIFLETEEKIDRQDPMQDYVPTQEMTPPGGDIDSNMDDVGREAGQMSELFDYLKNTQSPTLTNEYEAPTALDLEARLAIPSSWRQDIMNALRLERMDKNIANATHYITGCLDDLGYIKESLEDISKAVKVSVSDVEKALGIIQKIAPPGIGARDLRERLILRCHALTEENEVLLKILERHFDDLIQGRFELIRKRLALSDEELRIAIEPLKSLAKSIAPNEDSANPAGVAPDASIVKTSKGWVVILHDESIPQLRLSPYASKLARNHETLTPEARDYLMRALNRAKWMMEALEQRKKTMRRILEAILEKQIAFFEHGFDELQPLRQEDIAEQLSIHPSTISRAVQEKFIETPHGMVPFKNFFPRGVTSSTTSVPQQSRNTVQDRLAAIIASEDPNQPYSDDMLVEFLQKENIQISRRTVCKYRDELRIPPAIRRKGLHNVMKKHS